MAAGGGCWAVAGVACAGAMLMAAQCVPCGPGHLRPHALVMSCLLLRFRSPIQGCRQRHVDHDDGRPPPVTSASCACVCVRTACSSCTRCGGALVRCRLLHMCFPCRAGCAPPTCVVPKYAALPCGRLLRV